VRSDYTNQTKRAFRITERLEGVTGFGKGDYVVVDALHKDHLEVFNSKGKWIRVANFDGSINQEKTEQGRKEPRYPLQKE
jgi:filamentous hemagglutinin